MTGPITSGTIIEQNRAKRNMGKTVSTTSSKNALAEKLRKLQR